MRISLTLLLAAFYFVSFAQPPNDECVNAINLNVNPPTACPNSSPAVDMFNFNNNGATPTTPYPTFTGCDPGGQTDAPAAEVWFTFTATSNEVNIAVNGLNTPNIVLFSGNDCGFLQASNCGSAANGAGNVAIDALVQEGNTYYIMVSGGNVNDQGNFTLTITSSQDCNPCLQQTDFFAGPPPNNGTYSSGQTVNFCYTINGWDVTGTIEWLHAVTFQIGPGWDLNTLNPMPPPSCGGDGQWAWYDSWVGCNTGDVFGPGFAYDSSSGLGCGGTANDGNPGNNWGDGVNGCSTITPANPFVFCFTITASDCPPNITGNSLGIEVDVHSDGESGSWTQVGCNSQTEPINFLASVVCCDDLPPLVIETPTSCPGACDGSLMITPGGGAGTGPWNVNVFDATNNIIFTASSVSGTITVPNLCAGNYSVLTTNVLTACDRSSTAMVIDGFPPMAIASNTGPFCPGATISLFGSTTGTGTPITYSWTGPNNYSSFDQNPTDATEAGTYTLVVNVAGCESDPVTTEVVVQPAAVMASASDEIICFGNSVQLFGSGAVNYDWGIAGTGSPITVTPLTTTTYTLTGTDANGCVATDEITITVNPMPTINIQVSGTPCIGSPLVLIATGAQTYQWVGGPASSNYVVTPNPPSQMYTVIGTDANGCQSSADITITVNPPPNAMASASPQNVCSGDPVELTASGGNTYTWSTGVSGQTITVNPTVTTIYEVLVTDFDGCQSTAQVEVTVDDPIDAPDIMCGTITPNSVEFVWDPITGATDYNVTVVTNQIGTLNGTTFTVDNLQPGEDVTITVEALGGGICGNTMTTFTCTSQDCPDIDIIIDPVPDVCLDGNTGLIDLEVTVIGSNGTGTGVWSGNCVVDANEGLVDPNLGGVGVDTAFFTFTEGPCIYMDTVLINIFETPVASINASANLVCIDEIIEISYTGSGTTGANFTWNFDGGAANPGTGIGPHDVSWPAPGTYTVTVFAEENGCISNVAEVTIEVDDPLPAPDITCGTSTTTSVEFNWTDIPGATFDVNVTTGQTGTLTGTTYTVDNIQPGEAVTIEVTADDGGPCGPITSTMTCNADDCPAFNIVIDPVNEICLDASAGTVDLSVQVTGGEGTGVGTWTGTGIVDEANGTFDPNDADVGTHTITYTYEEGPCSETETIDIIVNEQPDADFTIDPATVCVDAPVTITYEGGADAMATYIWNFNGGTADPGDGQGPHTVSWATPGTKTVTLIVEMNDCASEQFTQEVTVENPLPEPVINCNTSTSSIEFFWDDVPGADTYEVTVISAHTGTQDGNTFTVDGLSPDEMVTIQVEAIGTNPCGNSIAEATCTAQNCPDVTIEIDNVADICLDASAGTVDLSATLMGDDGTGTESWDGPGIIDMDNGIFDPNDASAGAGTHTINYTYEQGNCSYNSTITITVNEQPSADFTVDSPICIDETASVVYIGSAAPDADYNWDFGDGDATPGTGAGPHEVSWTTSGMKTISLTVTEADCTSEVFEQMIQVDEPLANPVITCNTSTTEITFSWEDVPGATGYNVTVLSGHTGTEDGNSISFTGLNPGDQVTIEVEAIGDTDCGSSFAELTCTAQDCENVTVTITPLTVCVDAGIQLLEATVDGGDGTGSYTWSGDGVIDAITGAFDPAMLNGDIPITVIYTEGVCEYNGNGTVTVNPVPTSDFTVLDPICIDGSTTVEYTGSASGTATFDWNFGDGVATPGTGPGPHEVSWTEGGTQTITLTVTENDCTAELFSQTLEVETQLDAPFITCMTTDNSITFTWADVPGAIDYEVVVLDGPAGTLDGTSYAVTSLVPNQEVTIQVTAIGNSVCGNSVAEATCVAQDCPPLSVAITGTEAICTGESATLTFDFDATSDGPFTVVYTINGTDNQMVTVVDGGSIDIDPSATSEYVVISVTDDSLPDCMYPANAAWTVTVNETVSAGIAADPLQLCAFEDTIVNLADLLIDADAGGMWIDVSGNAGSGFNDASGTLNIAGLTGDTYNFAYVLDAPDPCPDAETIVTIDLLDAPVADAGEDQELTCNMGMVTLGGNGTSSGTGITYTWTSDDPDLVLTNPNGQFTEVGQEGTFILTVSNEIGCSSSDEVLVSSEFGVPVADVSIRDISCFEAEDGTISIDNVSGGTGPYQFSLNDGPFSAQTYYPSLGPGSYSLVIQDQNGCTSELMIDFTEPDEVIVNLIAVYEDGNDRLQLGDSVQLIAEYDPTLEIDTIMWEPDTIGLGDNSAAIWVSPETSTSYTVTIVDINGCTDDDRITVIVEKTRPIYIPNAFSPNGDEMNDIFFINAGEGVKEVKAFAIFNRWGEPMIELFNFQPNDPGFGWDGMHRGKPMNPAVFAYFAEIEFEDGEVILYEGEVILMK